MGKPWLVAKVTLRQCSQRRLHAIGWKGGGLSLDRVHGGKRVGLGGVEPACFIG